MLKKGMIFAICWAVLMLSPQSVFSDEEEKERRYPTIEGEDIVAEVIPEEKSWKERWSVDLDGSLFQGYDDNASLDAERKEDYFTQSSIDLNVDYRLSDFNEVKFSWNDTNLIYWDYTDATLIDNVLSLGMENSYFDNITLYMGYEYDYLYFPDNELATYIGNSGEVSAKQKIEDSIYHKLGYAYQHRGYKEKRANDAVNNPSRHREDDRHTIRYEVGTYAEQAMTKFRAAFVRNDSNDKYLDYYDYNAYQAGFTFICLLTEKFYLYTNGSYEFRSYKGRSVPNKDEDEEDDTVIWNSSLFYDLTKSLTLGLNYSYREVFSNYEAQEYSGSIVSAGVYYSF